MYLKRVEQGELPTMYRRSKLQRIIREFIESDMQIAQVNGGSYVQAGNGAGALNAAIKRYRFAGVFAISRNGAIYLIKEPIAERESD